MAPTTWTWILMAACVLCAAQAGFSYWYISKGDRDRAIIHVFFTVFLLTSIICISGGK